MSLNHSPRVFAPRARKGGLLFSPRREGRSRRRSAGKLWWALALVLVVAGAVAAWLPFPTPEVEKVVAPTVQVERGPIEDVVAALGSVQPRNFVDVGTQVTGKLKLKVAVGDKVKKGDLVAEIDPALFKAKLEASRATLASLHAQRSEREAAQRLAWQQYTRNQELLDTGAVSEELLQQSAAALKQTTAQVEALSAQIEQMQSQIRGDEANLNYTNIFAPISGTVVSITAQEGQTLVAAQQAPIILRIADLSTMTVAIQVSEAEIPRITLGTEVYFNTLGQRSRRWHGRVRQVIPTPQVVNNVVLYSVLFEVANPDGALLPQMSAQAYFVLARADDALLVPVSALAAARERQAPMDAEQKPEAAKSKSKASQQEFVVRVLSNGQVEKREVSVGVMTRSTAQVVSGLKEGETVLLTAAGAADGKKEKKKKGFDLLGFFKQ